eukprot:14349071-Heterocapsa_arctica.AAC.1
MGCNQVRAELLERVLERWGKTMEHDIGGSGLDHFKEETGDKNEWGDAEQIAVFAHIHKMKVEVHAYGMDVQVFDGGELELDQT